MNPDLALLAADRIEALLDRRAKMLGLDQELIYGIDGHEYELRTSDLRALINAVRVTA